MTPTPERIAEYRAIAAQASAAAQEWLPIEIAPRDNNSGKPSCPNRTIWSDSAQRCIAREGR